jgi:hypothetical protein
MGSFEGLIYQSGNWQSTIIDGIFSSHVLTIDVPDDYYYQILGGFVKYITSATNGDRRLAFTADNVNAGSSFLRCPSGVLQTASQTRYYSFGIGLPEASEAKGDLITVPISPVIIPDDHRMRVIDLNNVDGAGDVLSGRFNVAKRKAA